jgi:hypothetical protein
MAGAELVLGTMVAFDIGATLTIGYQLSRLKGDLVDRTDRYASALLHKQGEVPAARLIAPPKIKSAPPDGRTRPQQIGLTPRQ